MLQLDPKWGETAASLIRRSLAASHPRLRERYVALSWIASGDSGIAVAGKLGKTRQSISQGVHRFNEEGPSGLLPDFKGHAGKRLTEAELRHLKEVPPRKVGLKTGRWSGKVAAAYLEKTFDKKVSPRTALRSMQQLGFRKKLPRKRFKKGDPKRQRAFAEELTTLEQNRSPRSQTVWGDEGQLWCEALLRGMWCLEGEEALVDSSSPSLREKIRFYVAVVRPMGVGITSIVDWGDQEHTALFLDKIRATLPGWRIDLLWDGSNYHQGEIVRDALDQNRIHLHPLPPSGFGPFLHWGFSLYVQKT